MKALDLAKALLDRGFHAPTMYFPLLVPECLMIEPTETESKETLDDSFQRYARSSNQRKPTHSRCSKHRSEPSSAVSMRPAPRGNRIYVGIRVANQRLMCTPGFERDKERCANRTWLG